MSETKALERGEGCYAGDDESGWICLDWYDGPLEEIKLVTFSDGMKLVEIKTVGGWVGETYRIAMTPEGEKLYDNHMRFNRETLVAMLDLIDGKPVKDWHDGE